MISYIFVDNLIYFFLGMDIQKLLKTYFWRCMYKVVSKIINKLIKTSSRSLFQELGREPTPEEIAERMELPLEKVKHPNRIKKLISFAEN